MVRVSALSSPFLLGFDQIERALDKASRPASDGYPPYNIERIAAAGGVPDLFANRGGSVADGLLLPGALTSPLASGKAGLANAGCELTASVRSWSVLTTGSASGL